MKKILFIVTVLLTTLMLSACNLTNNVELLKYSNSISTDKFATKFEDFDENIKKLYSGDYSLKATHDVETVTTSQYDNNETSLSTTTEKSHNSLDVKVDLLNEICTEKANTTSSKKVKSASTTLNETGYEKTDKLYTTDGYKTVFISKDDKSYYTTDAYVDPATNKKVRIFDNLINSFVADVLTINPYLNNKDADYYFDNNNIYTIIYTDTIDEEDKDNDTSSTTVRNETIQLVLENNKITYLHTITLDIVEKNGKKTTTTTTQEKTMVNITYEDVEIEVFDYISYECLDEEDD